MRRPLIAGNWKMNLNRASAVALAEGVAKAAARDRGRRSGRLPAKLLPGRRGPGDRRLEGRPGRPEHVSRAGRGLYRRNRAPRCSATWAARYVILGHSERRHILGETDAADQQEGPRRPGRRADADRLRGRIAGRARSWANPGGHPPPVRRLAGRRLGRADGKRRHRLRAGLGDRHRQGGHPPTGGGGPSRPSQDHRRAL